MTTADINAQTTATLRVAVVGHTNTGKTSLIRTLIRDENFGEVKDAAGTTREVTQISIGTAESDVISLYDTPGLEDSTALLQAIDLFEKEHSDLSPSAALPVFIERIRGHAEFDQDAKVIQQALHSDVLLYIIDVHESLLGKYKDEVSILSKCGKPIIPVFNFIADNEAGLARWREQMAQFNLHAALEFDTVAFDFEAEKRLYQKLQSLRESHYDALQQLIDYRESVWQALGQAAARRIFQLLLDVGCYRSVLTENDSGSTEAATRQMQAFTRKAEERALRDLLRIFSFSKVDAELQQLPVEDGRWQLDVFSPAALKAFGLNASSSALTGAAAGAGVDLMVGGLTFGTATLVGAALGAGMATARRYKQELKALWDGNKWLCVDDNTVALIFLRQQALLDTLSSRGHAAQNTLEVDSKKAPASLPDGWHKALAQIRQHPQWQTGPGGDNDYKRIQSEVIGWLLRD